MFTALSELICAHSKQFLVGQAVGVALWVWLHLLVKLRSPDVKSHSPDANSHWSSETLTLTYSHECGLSVSTFNDVIFFSDIV